MTKIHDTQNTPISKKKPLDTAQETHILSPLSAYSHIPLEHPICLVGMPGSGKSVTGRELAKQLGIAFFDADTEIEIASNMAISHLFETYGEAYFRQGETRVIQRLISNTPCVIATGGGAFINGTTRDIIQTHTTSIYLDVPISTLWERISKRTHRPLFAQENPHDILIHMFKDRTPIYANAHIHITPQGDSPSSTARTIIHRLHAISENTSS